MSAKLFFLNFSLFFLVSCSKGLSSKDVNCANFTGQMSPLGNQLFFLEDSPSVTVKSKHGFSTRYKSHLIESNCDKKYENCNIEDSQLHLRFGDPKIIWGQRKESIEEELYLWDELSKNITLINLNRLPTSVNLPVKIQGDWNFGGLLTYDATQKSRHEIDPGVSQKITDLVVQFNSNIDDLSPLNKKFTRSPLHSKLYMDGTYASSFFDYKSLNLYSSMTDSQVWTQTPIISLQPEFLDVVLTEKNEILYTKKNQVSEVMNQSVTRRLDFSNSMYLLPIINRSTGKAVGISNLRQVFFYNPNDRGNVNKIVQADLKSNRNLSVFKIETTASNKSLIVYKDWVSDHKLFRYVDNESDQINSSNLNAKSSFFRECFLNYNNTPKKKPYSVSVDVFGEGTKKYKVLNLLQSESKGSVFFIKGGPSGSVLNESYSKRIYEFYLQKGFDIYAIEYSGNNGREKKLVENHELALSEDVRNLTSFIRKKKKAMSDENHSFILHSESFGSLLAVAVLNEEDNQIDKAIFVAPWVIHQNPEKWFTGDLELRYNFEKIVFGIGDGKENDFIGWMKKVRGGASFPIETVVFLAERDHRIENMQTIEYFKEKNIHPLVVLEASHHTLPVSKTVKSKISNLLDN